MGVEPAVGVHAGVEDQANVIAMRENSVHELPAQLAELFLALRIPEKILAALADRNVGVHAAAVHAHDGLGEKTCAKLHIRGYLAADQLVELNLICSSDHLSIAIVDLELLRRDFRMIFLVLKIHGALYF